MDDIKKSVFSDAGISRDEDLDIGSMLSEIRDNAEKRNNTEDATTIKPTNSSEKKLSPLEQLKADKKNAGPGLVLDNNDIKKDEAPQGNIVYNDTRMSEIEAEVNNYDDNLEKRKYVTVIKKPMNYVDYVQLMDELELVTIHDDGTVTIELKDDDGNYITPSFIKVRGENDAEFDYSLLTKYEKEEMKKNGTLTDKVKEATTSANDENAETDTESNEDDSEDENKISPEKKKMVEILIDKTGLGGDFVFTPEEREKISEAETIRVNEVKLIDIASIKSRRSDKSFQDTIKSYDLGGSRTTICFPASGFKAQMKGLSYGEYADVALSMDNVKFDQYYKRLTIIYNKMTNISTGPFKDFEDFLKHFAYTDIPLALYGMYIATEKEEQEIPLKCGNRECGKTFNWSYSTRGILRLERCADTFLSKMQEIATAPAMEYDNLKKNAAVNNSKYVQLPDSGIICEMGVASAYDFLYNFIPLMNEDTFKEAFGNDINEIYMDNILLLTSIRSVLVPDDEGNYVECTGYKDILDAIYHVGPSEIQILAAYTAKIQANWEITFSFGDVQCPHCQSITKNLDVSMDDLVFQTYNRLMSTEIDLSKIQDL